MSEGTHAQTVPGQPRPKQATGGQASTILVRFPSDALVAVAPSSQSRAAAHQDCDVFATLPGTSLDTMHLPVRMAANYSKLEQLYKEMRRQKLLMLRYTWQAQSKSCPT